MKKHGFALAFGLIGAGVMGYINSDSDMFLLKAAMGFCFGIFIGYFVMGLFQAKSVLLQQDFQKLGNLRGLTLDEIIAAVGNYKSFQQCTITDMDNKPGYLYTWSEDQYSITLLFGADKVCIGVNSEIKTNR